MFMIRYGEQIGLVLSNRVTPSGPTVRSFRRTPFTTSDNETLDVWIRPGDNTGPVVFFAHGSNTNNTNATSDVLQTVRQWEQSKLGENNGRVTIISPEYRGFGASSGVPNQWKCVSDIYEVYAWAISTELMSPRRTILVGHSAGASFVLQSLSTYGSPEELPAVLGFAGGIFDAKTAIALHVPRILSMVSALPKNEFNTQHSCQSLVQMLQSSRNRYRTTVLIGEGEHDRVSVPGHGRLLCAHIQPRHTLLATPNAPHFPLHEVERGGTHDTIKSYVVKRCLEEFARVHSQSPSNDSSSRADGSVVEVHRGSQ